MAIREIKPEVYWGEASKHQRELQQNNKASLQLSRVEETWGGGGVLGDGREKSVNF